ncbi:hypothetical protein DPMN_194415 [Dreissena polymorpha]|uniref:Uncharacterized protein n=1 Tax=Dreissena polymorpha TaxID=45954 RepID=A0A9D3Y3C9_DREPO|nr:hypothetical protein DPMN_194415 [Dreissena polymorpha]
MRSEKWRHRPIPRNRPPVFTALPVTGTNIFDCLKHATETLHTFSVTDSDDAVTCSARVPENALLK